MSRTYFFVLRDEPTVAESGVGYDLDCIDTRRDDGAAMRCKSRGGASFADDSAGVDNQARKGLARNSLSINDEGAYPPLFNGCDTYFGDPSYSIGGFALERKSRSRRSRDNGSLDEPCAELSFRWTSRAGTSGR